MQSKTKANVFMRSQNGKTKTKKNKKNLKCLKKQTELGQEHSSISFLATLAKWHSPEQTGNGSQQIFHVH